MADITDEVDKDICVILSPMQRKLLEQCNPLHGPRNIALQGGPGSGKTLLLLELLKKLITTVDERNRNMTRELCMEEHELKENTNSKLSKGEKEKVGAIALAAEDVEESEKHKNKPILIVTTAYHDIHDPIMKYLAEKTEQMKGSHNRVVVRPLIKLMEKYDL